jgi:DNA-binding transcriptional regulator YiaG
MTKTSAPTMTSKTMREIRDRLGKTQREMALMLGVELRGYQRWELGERKIPGPVVLLVKRIIADHQNVTANCAE